MLYLEKKQNKNRYDIMTKKGLCVLSNIKTKKQANMFLEVLNKIKVNWNDSEEVFDTNHLPLYLRYLEVNKNMDCEKINTFNYFLDNNEFEVNWWA